MKQLLTIFAVFILTGAGNLWAQSKPAYLFTSFRGNGDGLHLAYSHDGYHWTDFHRIFLKPAVGGRLLRDPQILEGPDGVFHMVWTTGWNDRGIGYASSTNLMEWSAQKYLPLMENVPGTQNCWAPELFYDADKEQFIIYWSSDVAGRFPETKSPDHMNNRAYYVVTRDFEHFSEPKVLFDPGFDNIDSTMVAADGKFRLVCKQGDDQQHGKWGSIFAAEADTPLGPYHLLPTPMITRRAEGPTLIAMDGKTLLYVDFYAQGHYGVYASADWKTWTNVSSQAEIVQGQRHGTVFAVAPAILDALLQTNVHFSSQVPQPILSGYTADPAIRVFGDTYYVYPTSDKPHWMTTDFSVWSSKNLIDWQKDGRILDVAHDLKWADIKAWAPDCVERNGKFYFYFCADGKIGVATSDHPTGPFVDALGHPLVERGGKVRTYPIDPYPFIDDDGQAYLLFGNGTPMIYKLNPDMISFAGEPVAIHLKQFREGIVLFKRHGKYYFMWSVDDARSDNYRVGYGMADSIYGPVTSPEQFIVLQKHGLVTGTGHNSVVNVPGTDRWYVAYHRHAMPNGSGYQRQTCLVRMDFNPDGSIKPMDPLQPAFPTGSAGEPVVNGRGHP
jgi:beta-xylosidase